MLKMRTVIFSLIPALALLLILELIGRYIYPFDLERRGRMLAERDARVDGAFEREAGAVILAERLCRMIFDHTFFPEASPKNRRLSVSIGLSSYPTEALSEEELVQIADTQLYRAKKEGKNRVCYQKSWKQVNAKVTE